MRHHATSRSSRPRAGAALLGVMVAVLAGAVPASAHSSFLGANPEPGARLAGSPPIVTLSFTEALNHRLTTGKLLSVRSGKPVVTSSSGSGRRLILRPAGPLPRGAYRVEWHSVSTDDGHALEGSFSFGVRAAALGGEHSVEQSPLARGGWLRILSRAVMYAALLLFVGALLLRGLLGAGGRSWLVPNELADGLEARWAARRERVLAADLGFVAAAAAAVSAVTDAADAAGGLRLAGLRDYLLASQAGLARLAVVVLVLLAGLVAARRPRAAAPLGAFSLGAVALSGHASAASPRALTILVDWTHLLAGAVWMGGIGLIVVVWGPILRRSGRAWRLSVARYVLPVFGRVALPAFGLVVVTGLASALIELGRLSALWETGYGRVLMLKMTLVAAVAGSSYVHALRLRPRLLSAPAKPGPRRERRHWRLLGAEPLLGVGIVALVALLVGFPLPPRQLSDSAEARAASAAACSPCPLPRPVPGQLAVADRAGSDVVAGWLRRGASGLSGEIRAFDVHGRPARDSFEVRGTRQTSCGPGCIRFRIATIPAAVAVALRQRGQTYVARLGARWQADSSVLARRLLNLAQARMRALRSVRETEIESTVPEISARIDYRLEAPNRLAYRTSGGVQSIAIGKTTWDRSEPRLPWIRGQFGAGLPFRTQSWFTWTIYASYVYFLGRERLRGRRVAVIATMDPGTPAWWRIYIDLRTHLVPQTTLITNGHFSSERYFAINQPTRIDAPETGHEP